MSVVSALTTLLAPTTCWAEPPVDQAASPQVRYRQAVDAFKAGKWAESRRQLLELWKEKQTFDVAVTLVQVEYQLAHYAAAARYLRFAIDNIPPTEKPETARDFKQQLDELRPRVGSVTVHVDADSADIAVDNEPLGTSPLADPIFVDPGNHKLTARLADRVANQDVTVVAGASYSVDLKVAGGPAPIQSGLVERSVPPQPDHSGGWWTTEHSALLGVGGGLTLLAAGFGIAYRIDAGKKQDDVDRLKAQASQELGGSCPAGSNAATCRQIEEAANGRNSSGMISNVSFAISGAFLVATATTLYLWPRGGAATTASVAPIAAPGFAGLSVKGAF